MISCDLLVTGRFIYCYLLCNNIFTTAKTYLLSSSEYCQWNENQNTIHGLTHDINSMPKLLYTSGFVRGITKSYKVLYLFLKNKTSYKVLYFIGSLIFF